MARRQVTFLDIQTADPLIRRAACELGERLGLPVLETTPSSGTYTPPGHSGGGGEGGLALVWTDDGLELREGGKPPARGVRVDFAKRDFRPGSRSMSRRQPLVKAVGRNTETVLDATAGLGRDAALLACLGYCVTAVERSPVIAALLEDGLKRAMQEPRLARAMGGRLKIIQADARQVLESMDEKPYAVYIDPMFPPKRKTSSLARKDVRLLRAVVGEDSDAVDLVEIALRQAGRRVIVKRPDYAEPLAQKPTVTFAGKLVRYDVYVK